MDEAYSYGYNNTRDASTLTPRKVTEPLVIPDDITNLPSMHGFVKFPDGFPAARIKLEFYLDHARERAAQTFDNFPRQPVHPKYPNFSSFTISESVRRTRALKGIVSIRPPSKWTRFSLPPSA